MPISKKRKKKRGAIAKYNRLKRREAMLVQGEDMTSGVTLQDLINMVAYQEYVEAGKIQNDQIEMDSTAKVEFEVSPGTPVTVERDGERVVVGSADPIPGDPQHFSAYITDPEVYRRFYDLNADQFSFEEPKENDDVE